MWVWSGFILSVGLAALAWWRAGARSRTFYEGEVYGMTPVGHRKYALGFTIGAAIFLSELVSPGWINRLENSITGYPRWRIPDDWRVDGLLAWVVLTGILYLAGFLRGASGEDE